MGVIKGIEAKAKKDKIAADAIQGLTMMVPITSLLCLLVGEGGSVVDLLVDLWKDYGKAKDTKGAATKAAAIKADFDAKSKKAKAATSSADLQQFFVQDIASTSAAPDEAPGEVPV